MQAANKDEHIAFQSYANPIIANTKAIVRPLAVKFVEIPDLLQMRSLLDASDSLANTLSDGQVLDLAQIFSKAALEFDSQATPSRI